jgi:hypothetical protein
MGDDVERVGSGLATAQPVGETPRKAELDLSPTVLSVGAARARSPFSSPTSRSRAAVREAMSPIVVVAASPAEMTAPPCFVSPTPSARIIEHFRSNRAVLASLVFGEAEIRNSDAGALPLVDEVALPEEEGASGPVPAPAGSVVARLAAAEKEAAAEEAAAEEAAAEEAGAEEAGPAVQPAPPAEDDGGESRASTPVSVDGSGSDGDGARDGPSPGAAGDENAGGARANVGTKARMPRSARKAKRKRPAAKRTDRAGAADGRRAGSRKASLLRRPASLRRGGRSKPSAGSMREARTTGGGSMRF